MLHAFDRSPHQGKLSPRTYRPDLKKSAACLTDQMGVWSAYEYRNFSETITLGGVEPPIFRSQSERLAARLSPSEVVGAAGFEPTLYTFQVCALPMKRISITIQMVPTLGFAPSYRLLQSRAFTRLA